MFVAILSNNRLDSEIHYSASFFSRPFEAILRLRFQDASFVNERIHI